MLLVAPCPSDPWGIAWPTSIAPGRWRCASCGGCYGGACSMSLGPGSARGLGGAPCRSVRRGMASAAAEVPALLLSSLALSPSPLLESCGGQTAPVWAAAKQRGARARSTKAAKTQWAGTRLRVSITFPFLVPSLFTLLSLPGSPAFPRRGRW